jgi:hypothetical protein
MAMQTWHTKQPKTEHSTAKFLPYMIQNDNSIYVEGVKVFPT